METAKLWKRRVDEFESDASSILQRAKNRTVRINATLSERDRSDRPRIFIGHGRSPQWRVLKDFLHDTLDLDYDEFNRLSAAGLPTQSRLAKMLDEADFAFLVMTAEDKNADGSLHARLNVIHELGLFQGRLGFERAIILLEETCEEFSNIIGLGQIRFPKDDVLARSEEIRAVLAREGIL